LVKATHRCDASLGTEARDFWQETCPTGTGRNPTAKALSSFNYKLIFLKKISQALNIDENKN
jgi:hypothetical protein